MNKINNNDITLNAETHTYVLQDDPNFEFTSATSFIHMFFAPFNKWEIATKLTKMPKYAGRTKQSFIDEWKASSEKGSMIHAEIENYILEDALPESLPGKHGALWLDEFTEGFELSPETIVYTKELALAGTADLLLRNPLTGKYAIVDWKTNKKIEMNSFRGKKGTKKATANVEDCNFNHYSLQLSLYRYILETYYGLEVENLYIVHVTDSGYTTIVCPYMKDTLLDMLNEN